LIKDNRLNTYGITKESLFPVTSACLDPIGDLIAAHQILSLN